MPYERFSLVAGMKAGWILAVRMASSCIACCIFHVIRWERLAHQLRFPFSKSSCFKFRKFHVPNGTVVWGRGGESPHGLGGGDVWHFRLLHISDNAPYLAPKILHNLCFSFLLGITAVPREIENNAPNHTWILRNSSFNSQKSNPLGQITRISFIVNYLESNVLNILFLTM